jgi:hypothetical protein
MAAHSAATTGAIPGIAATAVLGASDASSLAGTPHCAGPDFGAPDGRTLDAIVGKFLTTGFQATNIGLAVKEIERMRAWRLSDEPVAADEDDDYVDPETRKRTRAKIFLAYTSNAGQQKGDSTSLQRECSARARFGNSTHALRALREMIARPKISRNERKTAEIGAFEVGNVAPLCCPGRT